MLIFLQKDITITDEDGEELVTNLNDICGGSQCADDDGVAMATIPAHNTDAVSLDCRLWPLSRHTRSNENGNQKKVLGVYVLF